MSVVVCKLYDISDISGQPKTSWPTIPVPKFVPEKIFLEGLKFLRSHKNAA